MSVRIVPAIHPDSAAERYPLTEHTWQGPLRHDDDLVWTGALREHVIAAALGAPLYCVTHATYAPRECLRVLATLPEAQQAALAAEWPDNALNGYRMRGRATCCHVRVERYAPCAEEYREALEWCERAAARHRRFIPRHLAKGRHRMATDEQASLDRLESMTIPALRRTLGL